MKKHIFIVGPTASGKSNVALKAAQKIGGEIINVDSVQCYKGVKIGSAQPSEKEMALVPHHLFGFVKPPDKMTAGIFRREAQAVIDNPKNSGPFIFTGGSGFYFDAIEYGMFESPPIPEDVKQKVETMRIKEGLPKLFEEVLIRDPKYATRIGTADSYRLSGALQVMLVTGRTVTAIETDFNAKRVSALNPQRYGLMIDRDLLNKKIELRLEKMLEMGLDAEVRGLLDAGHQDWWPLSSVGFKETASFLRGEIGDEERRSEIIRTSMALAKRQMTWFRRDKAIEWFEDPEKLFEKIVETNS